MKCVALPTPQPRQSGDACEDRSVERYAMRTEKPKHQITMRRKFTCHNGNCACRHTALIVMRPQKRRETHFLDDDLAPINSTTAQTSCLIHVPPLPYSSARILHAGVVLLSLCRKRVHASKVRALFVFRHLVHA